MPRDMFFGDPGYAIYFFLIPLLILLFIYGYRARNRSLQALFEEVGAALYSRPAWRVALKSVLIGLGVALAILALMNPQGNLRQQEQSAEVPVDLYLLLDRSLSMDVKDAKNGLSRFERAKQIADGLLDELSGEAVAVYGFTDSVELLVPLTYDAYFARLVLRDTTTASGGQFGTDFETVLKAVSEDLAEKKYSNGSLLVFLTDGEDTKWIGNPATPSLKVLENTPGLKGVSMAAIIIGSEEGGEIPSLRKEGKAAVSKAQQSRLSELSQMVILQDQPNLVSEITALIEKARKTAQIARSQEVIADSYYQIPLALALMAFIAAWYLPMARLSVLLLITLPAFGEIWLQDRLYYNQAVEALQKGNKNDAVDLLMGISPQAYPSPIFRSRIAINFALASVNDPQTGLWVMRFMQLLPCDPLNLCLPELQEGVLSTVQEALAQQSSPFNQEEELKAVNELLASADFPEALRNSYEEYAATLSKSGASWDYVPLLHFGALMPTPEVIDRLKILLSFSADSRLLAIAHANKTDPKELLAMVVQLLAERNPQDSKEALRNLMQATVAVSFLQLMGAGSAERKLVAEMFSATQERFGDIQHKQFAQGICQCSPWDHLMPLFWTGGGYLQQGLGATTTELKYGFENAAQEQFRKAIAQSTSSSNNQSNERKTEQQLQEMQQLDRAPQPEKRIQDSGAGLPW